MKNFIILLSCFTFISITVFSQTLSGRISSSLYSFQRFDTVDVSQNHLRSFQMLSLNLNKDNFSIKSYFNLENDLSKQQTEDPRLRFYNLYLEARNVFDLLTFKLGRQPLFNSFAGGIYDGLNLTLRKGAYKLTGYYGGNVPAYQKLEMTKDWWKDNFIAGGKFSTTVLRDFEFSLSYVNKDFKQQDYWATRLDADLNPIQVLIRNNSNEYQFASAAVNYNLKDVLSVDTHFDYDLNYMQASKFEFYGSYDQIKDLKLDIYYNFRAPRIRYNSIFSVFDYGNTQEIEIGGDYSINKIFTITGKFGNVQYKDDNSQRFTLGLSSNYGNISYRKTFGYEGELDAISIYSGYSFLEGLLSPSLGVSYTNYKLSKDSNTNELAAVLAGLNVRPLPALSFDLQGQYMNNRIYKNDYRFFLKINYWFYTNF